MRYCNARLHTASDGEEMERQCQGQCKCSALRGSEGAVSLSETPLSLLSDGRYVIKSGFGLVEVC